MAIRAASHSRVNGPSRKGPGFRILSIKNANFCQLFSMSTFLAYINSRPATSPHLVLISVNHMFTSWSAENFWACLGPSLLYQNKFGYGWNNFNTFSADVVINMMIISRWHIFQLVRWLLSVFCVFYCGVFA